MSVSIKTREISDVVVVDLAGRITLGEPTRAVRAALGDVISEGHKKILVKLGEVEFMDSAGLGELLNAFRTLGNQGGQMKLLNVTSPVLGLMKTTGMDQVFEFLNDETTAVGDFS